ncbi:MAG: hypothetical protein AAF206_27065 [Bacteroidota bacterium]
MKKKAIRLTTIICLLVALGIVSGFFQNNVPDQAAEMVRQQYAQDLLTFQRSVSGLHTMVHKQTYTQTDLQASLNECRENFKRCEYLLTYFSNPAVNRYINGAPLPKVDPQSGTIVHISKPKGLQRLDEIVHSEEWSDQGQLLDLCKQLLSSTKELIAYENGRKKIDHRQIFEAIRLELVRIFTLGITGFDTPGSANGLQESVHAIEGLEKGITPYLAGVSPKLKREITVLFAEAKAQLRNGEFDTFDRMHFLKTAVNPLYERVLKTQYALTIEFVDEVLPYQQSTSGSR